MTKNNYVKIFDTTLRDGEQAPGFSMTSGQKLRLAKSIEALGADVIEAGFAAASPGDFEGIQNIAKAVTASTVCSLARCNTGDIRASGEAIAPAKSGRIHTFIATSPLHREFKLKMSKDEIVERAVNLGMAVANSLAAVRGGARQVECAINGIGERAGNCALEEVAMALNTRKDFYGLTTGINTPKIYAASKLLASITGNAVPRNKAIVGKNAFAHESGIHQHGVLANRETYEIMRPEDVGVSTDNLVLGKHSGRAALKNRAEKLGFTLEDNQLASVFVAFKALADEKKEVFDADIEALIMGEAVGTQGPWKIDSLYVSAGSDDNRAPQATVTLCHEDGRKETKVSDAAGPVNAVFHAISDITGQPLHLESFTVQSVTEGEDAMAEAAVRVSTEFESYQGRGTSTDTVLAGAKAYLDVINRIERRAVRQRSIAAQH